MANHHFPEERDLSGERNAFAEPPEPSWRPQDPDLPDERGRAGDDRDDPGGGGELRDARRWDSDEEYANEYEYEKGDAYRGREFDPERHELSAVYEQRTGYTGALRRRGDERIGEPAGSYRRSGAWDAAERTGAAREVHAHRGMGPHRGKGPAGYQRSDERIRELVCELLTDDDEIDASHIEVGVSGGEVTLSGTVDDRCTKRAAEDCAYRVAGVRDVQNRLHVRDTRASSNPSGAGAVDPHETQSSAPGSKLRA